MTAPWSVATCNYCGAQLVADGEFARGLCDPCAAGPMPDALKAEIDEAEDRAAADILRFEGRR